MTSPRFHTHLSLHSRSRIGLLGLLVCLVPGFVPTEASAQAEGDTLKRRPTVDFAKPLRPGMAPAVAGAAAAPGAAGAPGAATPGAAPTPGATPGSPGAAGTPPTTVGGRKQGDTSSLPQFESAMEYEPRSPNARVTFSLEDADLPELVRVIGQLTGRRFIFGNKVNKNLKATVYSPQKVTVAEAYQAFLSILETNGLTVVPQGRFLKIMDTQGSAAATPLYRPGRAVPNEDRYVTRMHRLKHASATEMKGVIEKFKSKDGSVEVVDASNMLIMTDTGNNIRRMMQILQEIDVGSAGDQIWIQPVHYGAASDIVGRINELFDVKAASAKPGPGAAQAAGDLHIAKVLADDRSNSIVIVATEKAYLRMLEFIKRIDIPPTGDGEIHVLPLQHSDAEKLQKTLSDIVGPAGKPAAGAKGAAPSAESVFEGPVRISADVSTNSLVVTSSLRDYASLRTVVQKLDQPRRQVFIDAAIMDLSVNRSLNFGVNWHGGYAAGDATDTLLIGGFNAAKSIFPTDALQGAALNIRGPTIAGSENLLGPLLGQNIGISIPAVGAIITALATSGDTDVLSTPHILATDNEKAIISIGENIPRQQNTGLGSLGSLAGAAGGAGAAAALSALGGGGGGFSGQFQDVGTKIEIKPHINDSDEVRLEVNEEISEAREAQGTAGVVPITKRTAVTQLVVKDQQTVVIGGLMRNRVTHSTTKVPLLGDIPVLGALFRQTSNSMQKTNLVLILTPYIIREQADLRVVFERKMQERQEFLDRYFVFSDSDYTAPKDYSRTNGLLEDIRQSYRGVEEKRKMEELTKPKQLKTHTPQTPLEMPASARSAGGPGGNPPAEGVNPPPATSDTPATPRVPATVTKMPRNLDRVER
jgi:general secretion pathway protein D